MSNSVCAMWIFLKGLSDCLHAQGSLTLVGLLLHSSHLHANISPAHFIVTFNENHREQMHEKCFSQEIAAIRTIQTVFDLDFKCICVTLCCRCRSERHTASPVKLCLQLNPKISPSINSLWKTWVLLGDSPRSHSHTHTKPGNKEPLFNRKGCVKSKLAPSLSFFISALCLEATSPRCGTTGAAWSSTAPLEAQPRVAWLRRWNSWGTGFRNGHNDLDLISPLILWIELTDTI